MKFPEKLWLIVNECVSGAIGWGTDGKTIFIDYVKFEKEFFDNNSDVFKTKNIVSFVRQLNLYGFRKCNRYADVHEFKNPYFVRGKKDLLKLMRRKLGLSFDIKSPERKVKMQSSKMFNAKDICIPDYSNSVEAASPAGTSDSIAYPSSPLQDWNLSPYAWWRNPYYPMNSLNSMGNAFARESSGSSNAKESSGSSKARESSASSNAKEDHHPGDDQKENANPSWGSLDNMYRNIVFVPVPAQYGMYPGLMNANLQMPFAMRHQNEVKNGGAPEE